MSQINSHIYIFCSDCARNGKTLLARLFCGNFPNTGPNQFHIFDTDNPSGDIATYFPQNSEVVDFSKTTGRMKLFDSIMSNPERTYVIDLKSALLEDFFNTYRNIDFDLEARAAGIGVVVYYIVDRDNQSFQNARNLESKINLTEFLLVKNEAIERRANYDPQSDDVLSLDHLRTAYLPVLSDDLLNLLEQEEFSLFDFMAGKEIALAYELKLELWNLLDFFYSQRAPDSQGITHFI